PDWSALFSQVVVAEGSPLRLVVTSGQVGVDAEQVVAGDGGFGAQVDRAFANLAAALSAARCTMEDVAKLTVYVVGFGGSRIGRAERGRPEPPLRRRGPPGAHARGRSNSRATRVSDRSGSARDRVAVRGGFANAPDNRNRALPRRFGTNAFGGNRAHDVDSLAGLHDQSSGRLLRHGPIGTRLPYALLPRPRRPQVAHPRPPLPPPPPH